MSGSRALPELRWIHDGVEGADSYCFNPHKWMLTSFDCSAFWVRDRRPLLAALSILPEYLRNAASESGAVIDYRDWHVQLGRRFRALKLWFVLRWYGLEGLRALVRAHVALARRFAAWVTADAEWDSRPGAASTRLLPPPRRDARTSISTASNARARLTQTNQARSKSHRAVRGQASTEARTSAAWQMLRTWRRPV